MRFFYFLFLVAFTGAAAFLAYQNQHAIELRVFDQSYTLKIPMLVGLSYLAGMFSGWTVVGMLRRSFHNVTSQPFPGEYATTRQW